MRVSGAAVPRGVPHRLRGGVQDRRGDPSASLQEGLPLVGHHRHVRRDGRGGEAAGPRRRRDGARAGDRGEHGVRHPRELRDDDQAAARRAARRRTASSPRSWPRAGSPAAHDALDRPVGLLPGLQLRRRVRRRSHRRQARQPAHASSSPGVSIKPYPCGVLGHPTHGRDAAAGDRRTTCKPEQITAIRVRAGSNILNPLRYPIAHNELEAKFCPAFMVSAIALRRKAGIHEFTDEFVRERAGAGDDGARSSAFSIRRSRRRASRRSAAPSKWISRTAARWSQHADERYRGGPDRPFTREELHEKFTRLRDRWCCRRPACGETFDDWWSRSRIWPTSASCVRDLTADAAQPTGRAR